MMRKKKRAGFPAMVLAGCMYLTAGCGAAVTESEADGIQSETAVQQEADGQEETAARESGSVFDSEEEQGEARSVPQLTIIHETLEQYAPDSDIWLLHAEYDGFGVTGDGYEAMADSARQWSASRAEELEALSEEYAGDALEALAYMDERSDSYLYSIVQSLEPVRVDGQLISIRELISEYTGGAHGNYAYWGYTFDAKSGQILGFWDLVREEADFMTAATGYILQQLAENQGEGLFEGYEDTVRNIWTREEGPNWYLAADGIVIIFNPYEIGPYAMGEVEITLLYEEFSEYIKEGFSDIL